MRNVKVVIEYDGTDFAGFQYQPGELSIQGELERVLLELVKSKVTVFGAGRTDAGVHAIGQVINFHSEINIPVQKMCLVFNSLLPQGISAVSAEEVSEDFHSRYCAKSRWYQYRILNRENKSAQRARFCWHIRKILNIDAMIESAQYLIGVNDFSSFSCAGCETSCFIRNLTNIGIKRENDEVVIDVRANAFLRSMVRVIIGTLVEVGLGKRLPEEMKQILEGRNRVLAGATAPACGLCLMEVEY